MFAFKYKFMFRKIKRLGYVMKDSSFKTNVINSHNI